MALASLPYVPPVEALSGEPQTETTLSMLGTVEEYDAQGNLLWRTTFDYDRAGRLTRKSVPIGTITYQYGPDGSLSGMQSSAGHDLTYEYNQRGQLKAVYQGDDALAQYAYDNASRLAMRTHGPGAQSTFTYNARSQWDEISTATTAGYYTQSYGYQKDGNIASEPANHGMATAAPTSNST